ncbi:hypothetical protein cypCar_00046827 [Cyprinus carpio]|nr:hypothetical protein cypCar_00046827 [Cyprinus carpio]
MVGNQGLGIASVSGAFPMIHHPVFSLHSSSPVRSEFGGLGSLGMSAALAAHSQLGALPGLNGSVNGMATNSPSPVLIPPDQNKSLKTSPKPALEEKTRYKTKDEEEMHTDRKKNRHTVGQDKLDVQGLLLSQPPLHIQALSSTEEPSKHTSVIQITGLAASTKPLALVTQRHRDRDAPSPKDLPLPSPKPPLSLSSSPTLPSSRSAPLKTCKNYLDNISKLKQSSLPQACPPLLRGAQESQSSQKHPFNNAFLPSLPTENHLPGAVQDAPLALITKPRSQSARAPDKPLLAATSPTFNTPINLTSTGRTSTSPGLTPRAGRGKGCQTGRRTLKRERPSLVEHFRGAESELPDSKDSDDSLMEDEDENDASNDSLSGKRRRVTDECALRKPLQYGWQRETRITSMSGRLRGEVVYYAPCGRKLRQYPDVIKAR